MLETERELPEGLLAALAAYQGDPEWFPPQGSPGLRAMYRSDGVPVKADFEWVDVRSGLIDEANEVWAEIVKVAPMPTVADVISGVPVYPDWVDAMWAETLQLPWSQNFESALEEAKAYLESASAT